MDKEYMEAILKFLKNELKDTPPKEWENFSNDLKGLIDELSLYNVTDENGNYKALDKDGQARLNKMFESVTDAAVKYLDVPLKNNNPHEVIRRDMTKKLNDEFLSKAYVAFQNVEIGKSLKTSMDNFRSKPIEVSKDVFEKIGGNQSSRTKLTLNIDGKEVKGVFTQTTTYNHEKDYSNLIAEMIKRYPRYADYFEDIDNERGYAFYAKARTENITRNHEVDPYLVDGLRRAGFIPDEMRERFEELSYEPDFLAANAYFIKRLFALKMAHTYDGKILNLPDGSNIDKRNSAMSGIAHLLGYDEVLAKSRPVTLERTIDGRKVFIEGTFMEEAKGTDLKGLGIKNPIREVKFENFNTPEAKRSLANLQIIDYICGNVDRHSGNMFYDFDPETGNLKSVQGIDNDSSFFRGIAKPNEFKNLWKDINLLRVIDAEMAAKIRTLEEGPFKATLLGYGLKNEEVDAAWYRAFTLKEALNNAEIFKDNNDISKQGKDITIIPADRWKDVDIDKAGASANNIFSRIRLTVMYLNSESIPNTRYIADASIMKFALESKLKASSELLTDAQNKAPFMGTSTRYKNVLRALGAIDGERNFEKKYKNVDALEEAIKVYKQEKMEAGQLDEKGNPVGNIDGKALDRINIVKGLEDYIKTVRTIHQEYLEAEAIKEKTIKDADEINATYRRGKYEKYARVVKAPDGRIVINKDILKRDESFAQTMKSVALDLAERKAEAYNTNDPELIQQVKLYTIARNADIRELKETLTREYHKGLIPKEYYDARIEQFNKNEFDKKFDSMFVTYEPQLNQGLDEFRQNLQQAVEGSDDMLIYDNESGSGEIETDKSQIIKEELDYKEDNSESDSLEINDK